MNIFLVGPMGAGKDQVASVLPNYTRLAMGDHIRSLCKILRENSVHAAVSKLCELIPELPDDIYEKLRNIRNIPQTDAKNRAQTQELGTYLRLIKDDIWISEVLKDIQPHKSFVITDARRNAEFDAFTSAGFMSVWVEASDTVRKQRLIDRDGRYDEQWETNIAESQIQGLKGLCNVVIENNGTIDELRYKVDYMMFSLTN